ncbi:MAG: hypothetical protein PHP85_01045 [Gallionella sp.]|nr:hypothetical protein [Gallionella sp.]
MAVISAAQALELGEIKIKSQLGQPLSVRIDFTGLNDADKQNLKVGLASVADYRKLGLQYPEGYKFRFRVVDDAGTQPYISVTTPHSVDDPFVNLLVETTSASGRLIKDYTFLLDPSPRLSVRDESHPSEKTIVNAVVESGTGFQPASVRRVKQGSAAPHPEKTVVKRTQAGRALGNGLHMKMSLSISSHAPSERISTDALQEELIVKEKLLEDLRLQIAEMQLVIGSLQHKQAVTEYGDTSVSGVVGVQAGREPVSGVEHSSLPVAGSAVQSAEPPASGFGKYSALTAIFLLMLSVALGVLWYRKKQRADVEPGNLFADLDEAPHEPVVVAPIVQVNEFFNEPVVEAKPVAPLTFERESVSQQLDNTGELLTMEPAEHIPIVPPEYAILMEANRYLRSGNDKLAEEALIQAISVNPKNLYGYQTLLGIYESRGDAMRFENIARQLKLIGDEAVFKAAAETGRRLDPDNPLYS